MSGDLRWKLEKADALVGARLERAARVVGEAQFNAKLYGASEEVDNLASALTAVGLDTDLQEALVPQSFRSALDDERNLQIACAKGMSGYLEVVIDPIRKLSGGRCCDRRS